MDIIEDIKNQYLTLLSFLTKVTTMSNDEFINKIEEISQMGTIMICYTRRENEGEKIIIIGSGTVIFEPKIIRGGNYVGHIEDIVVHNMYRSHGIARIILERLFDIAEQKKCYKVILDCNADLEKFYKKIGCKMSGIQMSKYFQIFSK